MKKHLISMLLAFAMLSGIVSVHAESAGFGNFKPTVTYLNGQFSDVGNGNWFSPYVQYACELGVMDGKSSTIFDPCGSITIAEAIKLAVCLNSRYLTDTCTFSAGSPWYAPYLQYAETNGILPFNISSCDAAVTRAQFAELIAVSLPGSAYPAINTISDNAVPDVTTKMDCAPAVYTLYRAGVMTGSDGTGAFSPQASLTRAEAAAVLARAANPSLRRTVSLDLTPEELFNLCSSSVFSIEKFDASGDLLGYGSGFFISSSGLALTNYHVISSAISATATTSDGTEYQISGVCGYDKTADMALIQVDGSGFSPLRLGNSDTLRAGQPIFTIGTPLGLNDTISEGIISNLSRDLGDGNTYFQFTAPISLGSGGGPVLNSSGQVVGLSCKTSTAGQNLNFAVPINLLAGIGLETCESLKSLFVTNFSGVTYYMNNYPVPDFGAYSKTIIYKSLTDGNGIHSYYYKLSDISDDSAIADGYVKLLESSGFVFQSTYINSNGSSEDVYVNAAFSNMTIHFGKDILDGVPCRFVSIA